ncbi:MAG TPA: hypothetical protein VM328_00750 [Fimbriimonadaceae bacterium]|nr:hypothetical protein [Fimbriimonadaceae bacterium]
MKGLRWIAIVGCLGISMSLALPQDGGLGKGKGKGGGNSGGNSSPPRNDGGGRPPTPPPRNDGNSGGGGGRPPQAPPRNDGNQPPRGNPPVNQGSGNQGSGDSGIGKPRGGGSGQQQPPIGGQGGSDRNGGRNTPPIIGGSGDQGVNGVKGRPQSRSGQVNYGSINNDQRGRERPVTIDRAPIDVRNGSLQYQVLREERISINRPYRSGYVHYDHRWRDDYFCYPYYQFVPVYNNCVVSPWYYYPHLPGYIVIGRIQPIQFAIWSWQGTPYQWRRTTTHYYGGYDNLYWNRNDLDYALDDLVQAFERQDVRTLGRLVPRQGRVNIALEGNYGYSLHVDDFYDMLADVALSSRTNRYWIEDVRTWRDSANVLARHEYVDPWGRRTSLYHMFRLEAERGGYVIRDFGTSTYRRW